MTDIIKHNNETGRSMVEMLGVLAIVGVLSIGGIAGYSKAMAKYKINKTLDQVSMLIASVRTTYGNQNSYQSLSNANAVSYGIVGGDLSGGNTSSLTNAYGGPVWVAGATSTAQISAGTAPTTFAPYFQITFQNLDNTACAQLVSSDWGSAAGGLVGMYISQTSSASAGTWVTWGNDASQSLPLSYEGGRTKCGSGTNGKSAITWVLN